MAIVQNREGGVMRLENLIADIDEEMFTKIVENRSVRDKDARDTAKIVGLQPLNMATFPIRLPRIIFLM